ncbi:hypothetical protein [Bythopirellula polymerisocia]|uniref:Uncharacterized protein n=1 Tax=Bythopirellula polymerisocia TaxID=2528003 RepID=A0A5C6D010_9BACT|nr:hypothetical protein [Bythopirellula polymerisocia]TWU30190.1 hypothetical protein Pla144_09760 [Bythopirellula polymerisocia]
MSRRLTWLLTAISWFSLCMDAVRAKDENPSGIAEQRLVTLPVQCVNETG